MLPIDDVLGTTILGTSVAVPERTIPQEMARNMAHAVFESSSRAAAVYDNAGVESRRSAMPLDWYGRHHGWAERAEAYRTNALELLENVARKAVDDAGIEFDQVDALVTISTTGFAIPSLDALLINRLKLRCDTTRLPVFGLGCAGGAIGLARSGILARGMPGTTYLLLVVEICSVNFRNTDRSATNFVSTALFGDGAAGVVVRHNGHNSPNEQDSHDRRRPTIERVGEWTWKNTEDVMGFKIEDDGLGIVLRPDVPKFAFDNLRPRVDAFLAQSDLTVADIDGFICHPGGRKVLQAIESSLELSPEKLDDSRDVLSEFGNMSAPTVLFVLDRVLKSGASGRHLMTAFGPGFSLALLLLDLQ